MYLFDVARLSADKETNNGRRAYSHFIDFDVLVSRYATLYNRQTNIIKFMDIVTYIQIQVHRIAYAKYIYAYESLNVQRCNKYVNICTHIPSYMHRRSCMNKYIHENSHTDRLYLKKEKTKRLYARFFSFFLFFQVGFPRVC